MMDMFDLIDIQRERHPNLNRYSYFSKALGLKCHFKKADIELSIASDHRSIYVTMSFPESCPQGPGFWKFNNLLLADEE